MKRQISDYDADSFTTCLSLALDLLILPVRDSSASLSDRSGGTPAGEPKISGSALRRPDRPDEAKSNTGSSSVISK